MNFTETRTEPKTSMTAILFVLSGSLVSTVVGTGCATTGVKPNTTPKELLMRACDPGQNIARVQGNVWMKAQSPEASGQFPAEVDVSEADSLKLEVNNLAGGTEARIQVDGDKYNITIPGKPQREQDAGRKNWGGIPLRWGTAVFLGRIPCPTRDAWSEWALSTSPEGDLVAERGGESFNYRFTKVDGKPWPQAVVWIGPDKTRVEFKFEDPDTADLSPRKWEAVSQKGSVKVRWRERKVERKAGPA